MLRKFTVSPVSLSKWAQRSQGRYRMRKWRRFHAALAPAKLDSLTSRFLVKRLQLAMARFRFLEHDVASPVQGFLWVGLSVAVIVFVPILIWRAMGIELSFWSRVGFGITYLPLTVLGVVGCYFILFTALRVPDWLRGTLDGETGADFFGYTTFFLLPTSCFLLFQWLLSWQIEAANLDSFFFLALTCSVVAIGVTFAVSVALVFFLVSFLEGVNYFARRVAFHSVILDSLVEAILLSSEAPHCALDSRLRKKLLEHFELLAWAVESRYAADAKMQDPHSAEWLNRRCRQIALRIRALKCTEVLPTREDRARTIAILKKLLASFLTGQLKVWDSVLLEGVGAVPVTIETPGGRAQARRIMAGVLPLLLLWVAMHYGHIKSSPLIDSTVLIAVVWMLTRVLPILDPSVESFVNVLGRATPLSRFQKTD